MVLKVFHDGSEPGELMENCCLCRAATRWWWGDGRNERGLVSIVRQNGEEVRPSNKGRVVRQGAPTKPATLQNIGI